MHWVWLWIGIGACTSTPAPRMSARCTQAPPTGAVWVQPGASGDGTPAAPFGSLDEALAAAPQGPIALWPGTYVDPPELTAAQDGLWLGAPCGGVTLTTDKRRPALTVQGATVSLADLTLQGGERGLDVEDASVNARDLTIAEVAGAGVTAHGASVLTLDRTLVRDVYADDNDEGYGVYIADTSTLAATDLQIARTWVAGVAVIGKDASIALDGLDVADTQRPEDKVAGIALAFADGAGGTVTDARLERSVGVHVASSGSARSTTITLEDVDLGEVVRHSYDDDDDPTTPPLSSCAGVVLANTGEAQLSRIRSHGPTHALGLTPVSGTLEAQVDGLEVDLDDDDAVGLVVTSGASVTATGVVVRGRFLYGAAAADGTLDLDTPIITGSDEASSSIGIGATGTGTVEIRGGEVSGVRGFGALAAQGGSITLDGTAIHDITAIETGGAASGFGLAAISGGTVDAKAVSLSTIHGPAVAAQTEGDLHLHGDSTITAIAGDGRYSGYAGMLISAPGEGDTRMEVDDTAVSEIVGAGFIAWGPRAVLDLQDTTLSKIYAKDAARGEGVSAILAYTGADVTARDVRVTDVDGNGVFADTSEGYDPADPETWTHVTLTDVEVGEIHAVGTASASAVAAQQNAFVDWDGGAAHDVEGPGIYLVRSAFSALGITVSDVEFAGLAAQAGSAAYVNTSTFTRVAASTTYGGGMAVWSDSSIAANQVWLDSLDVHDLSLAGVVAVGGGGLGLSGGSYRSIDAVPWAGMDTYGNAVIAVGMGPSDAETCTVNTRGLCIDGSSFHADVAPKVLLSASSAWLCGLNGAGDAPDVVASDCTGSEVVSSCADDPVAVDPCVDDAWPVPGVRDLTIGVAVPDVEIVEVDET